jgi:hypothetical protein
VRAGFGTQQRCIYKDLHCSPFVELDDATSFIEHEHRCWRVFENLSVRYSKKVYIDAGWKLEKAVFCYASSPHLHLQEHTSEAQLTCLFFLMSS